MMIFCKFGNGRQSGYEAIDDTQAVGYVEGLASAALCLSARVWVTGSLPNEAGPDNDGWREARTWLEQNS